MRYRFYHAPGPLFGCEVFGSIHGFLSKLGFIQYTVFTSTNSEKQQFITVFRNLDTVSPRQLKVTCVTNDKIFDVISTQELVITIQTIKRTSETQQQKSQRQKMFLLLQVPQRLLLKATHEHSALHSYLTQTAINGGCFKYCWVHQVQDESLYVKKGDAERAKGFLFASRSNQRRWWEQQTQQRK